MEVRLGSQPQVLVVGAGPSGLAAALVTAISEIAIARKEISRYGLRARSVASQ
jgi:ribulose 1,5-bisphosphate synthetase/thiazole synthase